MKNYKQAFVLSLIAASAIPAFADPLDGFSDSSKAWRDDIRAHQEAEQGRSSAIKTEPLAPHSQHRKKRLTKKARASTQQNAATAAITPQAASEAAKAAGYTGTYTPDLQAQTQPTKTAVQPRHQQNAGQNFEEHSIVQNPLETLEEHSSKQVGEHQPTQTQRPQPTVAQQSDKGFLSWFSSGRTDKPMTAQDAADYARAISIY